jgi:hypothetical protein
VNREKFMNQKQTDLARHALGLPNKRNRSYRNYFTAGFGHNDYDEWMAMVTLGDAVRREKPKGLGGDDLFWLTLDGARQVLRPKETLDLDDFPAPLRVAVVP